MLARLPRILLMSVVVISVSMAGCGKVKNAAQRNKSQNDLKELGGAYWTFQDMEGRPPNSYAELNGKVPMSPGCAQATVTWGAGMGPYCKEGASSEVTIGYITDPDGKRKSVLYCDGSVRSLTEREYNAAKKAKPLPPKK